MFRNSESTSCRHAESTSTKMVVVPAPATLRQGFVFWASVGDKSFPVTVPAGGVTAGQTLTVPLIESQHEDTKGKWKDGLCSCFTLGISHPTLYNAWLCPQVLLGQLLTRMKMNWLATPSSKPSFQSTFRKIMALLFLFSVYDIFVRPPLFELVISEEGELSFTRNDYPFWHLVCYVLLSLPMSVYGIVVVAKLRAAIRAKYGIPTGRLGRMEDFMCVCFCNCCVFAQMARQTADYEQEPAACCSLNGIRNKVTPTEETTSLV